MVMDDWIPSGQLNIETKMSTEETETALKTYLEGLKDINLDGDEYGMWIKYS